MKDVYISLTDYHQALKQNINQQQVLTGDIDLQAQKGEIIDPLALTEAIDWLATNTSQNALRIENAHPQTTET